ncbi:MAG: hypothetical protein FWF15_08495 [Oscillospiraceae bacterium]|nr:hypothetical protein [Oscillospiraceae bacterium]
MKHVTLFIIFLLLVTFISSCASGTDAPISNNQNETTDVKPETAETKIDPKLPTDIRYDGYEFRVYTKGLTNVHWKSIDIAALEINGEPINDAVYARNLAISEKYGVTVLDIPGDYNNMDAGATKSILSGDDEYDMMCYHTIGLVNNGYLINLYDVPYLNLTQPYYDQNCVESLTIKGKLFAVTGDLLMMDNNATWCVQFNKNMGNDLGLEAIYGKSMYDLVNANEWTLGFLYTTAKMAAKDVDGDGIMHELNDIWGFQTEGYNNYAFLIGSGERIASLDKDGYPQINLYGERAATVMQTVLEVQNDKKVGLNSAMPIGYADVWSEVMDKNFIESRVLYNVAGLNRVTLFRTMEVDFGILPIPKYEEKQEGYQNPVSLWCANYISIPKSATVLERTGIIIEALSCESKYTLLPAYYEITLKTKASRDEDSLEMLDLIFATTVFDLGYYYNWGDLNGFINGLVDAGTYVSRLTALEKTINAAIEKTLTIIDET